MNQNFKKLLPPTNFIKDQAQMLKSISFQSRIYFKHCHLILSFRFKIIEPKKFFTMILWLKIELIFFRKIPKIYRFYRFN